MAIDVRSIEVYNIDVSRVRKRSLSVSDIYKYFFMDHFIKKYGFNTER